MEGDTPVYYPGKSNDINWCMGTKDAMGWPQEPAILVPDDVAAYFADRFEAKKRE
jgi:hypothetical protein